jgi:hypothetical protein
MLDPWELILIQFRRKGRVVNCVGSTNFAGTRIDLVLIVTIDGAANMFSF